MSGRIRLRAPAARAPLRWSEAQETGGCEKPIHAPLRGCGTSSLRSRSANGGFAAVAAGAAARGLSREKLTHLSTSRALKASSEGLWIGLRSRHTNAVGRDVGVAYLNSDRPKGALSAFDPCLRHEPDEASHHDNRGLALGELGRAEESRREYGRAISSIRTTPQPGGSSRAERGPCRPPGRARAAIAAVTFPSLPAQCQIGRPASLGNRPNPPTEHDLRLDLPWHEV
jgi:tetratricopeptide (TPR) repeat protein